MAEVSCYLLLLILALAALTGVAEGTEPWSRAVVEGLCLLVTMLQLLSLRRRKSSLHPVRGMLPLVLLAGYLALQVVPLPPSVLKLISPKTWELYAGTVWIVRPDIWMPLSVVPKLTLVFLFRLVSGAALYFLTVQLFVEKERLKRIIPALALFVGPFSLVVGILFFVPEGRAWGSFGKWPAYLRDHYAGLMAMVFPLLLAQYLASRPHINYSSVREKTAKFVRNPGSYPHLLVAAVALCVAVSIIASLSMKGILSSLGAVLVFLLLLLTRSRGRKWEVWGTAFLVGMLFTVGLSALVGNGELGRRMHAAPGQTFEERLTVWGNSEGMVRDFPLFGTGAGTFAQVFPRYATLTGNNAVAEHADNDYLEYAVEEGGIGLLLAGWFLLSVLRYSFPAWRQRHSRIPVYLYLGSLCGLVAILLQSWADFTLHVGAILLYFFFISGLAVAAATSSRTETGGEPDGKVLPITPRWPAALAGLLLVFSLVFNVGILAGKIRFAKIAGLDGEQAPDWEGRQALLGVARQASCLDPLEPTYRFALADIGLGLGEAAMTLRELGSAVRLAPLNAEYLQRLGLVYDHLGEEDKAERLLEAGVKNDRVNPVRHKTFAFWLLSKGKPEKALEQIRQAILGEPQRTWDYLTLMKSQGLSDEAMRRNLPQRSLPLLIYGDYLLGAGKEAAAEESYRTAVNLASAESHPSPTVFQRVGEFFAAHGRYNDALETILAGIEIFPDNAEYRFAAAGYYEKLGITYRAVEEYRSALALDPKNDEARARLKGLENEMR